MDHFGRWVLENKLDPTPPIQGMINLATYSTSRLEMNSTVSQQTMSGLSNGREDVPLAETYFNRHLFSVGRMSDPSPHKFKGIYKCTGNLFASPDLSSDLTFEGTGNFTVNMASSVEMVQYDNVGITDNYEFNPIHSWYNYLYFPELDQVKLAGTWDSSGVNKYLSLIDEGFISAYSKFLTRDLVPEGHPSGAIFLKFVDEIIKTTNLQDILLAEELPQPYLPTTSTTTEPPTTENTEATTIDNTEIPTTTTDVSNSTKPETTEPHTTDNSSDPTTTTEGNGSSDSSLLVINNLKVWLGCLVFTF